MTHVLALDIAGNPFRWLDLEQAICYAAAGRVAWALGEAELVFHGGTNRAGERSVVAVQPVIALARSEAMVRHAKTPPLGRDNAPLFRRDRNVCAYCGQVYPRSVLTRDHIMPRARGGRDDFCNTATACRSCNEKKACRTPEEAGMPLLYVPYQPCLFEHFILTGRRVLADQMSYLTSRLPRHSRAGGLS